MCPHPLASGWVCPWDLNFGGQDRPHPCSGTTFWHSTFTVLCSTFFFLPLLISKGRVGELREQSKEQQQREFFSFSLKNPQQPPNPPQLGHQHTWKQTSTQNPTKMERTISLRCFFFSFSFFLFFFFLYDTIYNAVLLNTVSAADARRVNPVSRGMVVLDTTARVAG